RNRFSFLSTPMVHGCTISVSVHPKWASLLALRLRCSTLDAKKRIDLTGVNFEECTRGHFTIVVKESDDTSGVFGRIRECIGEFRVEEFS
ncbi:hypothetical protein PRIPAC_74842, partial [Pristionchus pacificus]|uniref:Uncharacterized protein n=1 Tax=Pristionchus pacificus TaxID=54126 RepID=A0A2A6CFC2_PRIPA